METDATAPVAPSSDVRERLGTAPPPRRQPLESRLGRPIDQNQTSSETLSRTSNIGELEHEHVNMSSGCKEHDGWRGSHIVAIISDIGRGLAISGAGAA